MKARTASNYLTSPAPMDAQRKSFGYKKQERKKLEANSPSETADSQTD